MIKGAGETPSFGNWTEDGFTITMWVRFLNTTGGGTLFTYGNPMTKTNSSFRLETKTVQADDILTYGGNDYTYKRARRVVRLVVWEDKRESPLFQESVANETFAPFPAASYERKMGLMYDSSAPYDFQPDTFVDGLIPGGDLRGFPKRPTWLAQMPADLIERSGNKMSENFLQYTDIPTDNLDEWFFICATYNPMIQESNTHPIIDTSVNSYPFFTYGSPATILEGLSDEATQEYLSTFSTQTYLSFTGNTHLRDELMWLNHKDSIGGNLEVVSNSSFGNKCKVEVISRSDLLRARGYKV